VDHELHPLVEQLVFPADRHYAPKQQLTIVKYFWHMKVLRGNANILTVDRVVRNLRA